MKTTLKLTETKQALGPGVGTVHRLIINSHTSGVVTLVDSPNGTSGHPILAETTLTSGAQVLDIGGDKGIDFVSGVHIIIGGTVVAQIVYELNQEVGN